MKTFLELMSNAEKILTFWKESLEKKNIAANPYEKEYNVVFEKWKRIDDEIQKLRNTAQDSSVYMTAANKIKLKQETDIKIARLTRQADVFLPEVSRLREQIASLNISKDECLKNIEDLENSLTSLKEGLDWENDYVKNIHNLYTIGPLTYYS